MSRPRPSFPRLNLSGWQGSPPSDVPLSVLLTGGPGVGKTLYAARLAGHGPRIAATPYTLTTHPGSTSGGVRGSPEALATEATPRSPRLWPVSPRFPGLRGASPPPPPLPSPSPTAAALLPAPATLRSIDVLVLMYDVTKGITRSNIDTLERAAATCPPHAQVLLLGNKIDALDAEEGAGLPGGSGSTRATAEEEEARGQGDSDAESPSEEADEDGLGRYDAYLARRTGRTAAYSASGGAGRGKGGTPSSGSRAAAAGGSLERLAPPSPAISVALCDPDLHRSEGSLTDLLEALGVADNAAVRELQAASRLHHDACSAALGTRIDTGLGKVLVRAARKRREAAAVGGAASTPRPSPLGAGVVTAAGMEGGTPRAPTPAASGERIYASLVEVDGSPSTSRRWWGRGSGGGGGVGGGHGASPSPPQLQQQQLSASPHSPRGSPVGGPRSSGSGGGLVRTTSARLLGGLIPAGKASTPVASGLVRALSGRGVALGVVGSAASQTDVSQASQAPPLLSSSLEPIPFASLPLVYVPTAPQPPPPPPSSPPLQLQQERGTQAATAPLSVRPSSLTVPRQRPASRLRRALARLGDVLLCRGARVDDPAEVPGTPIPAAAGGPS